MTLHHKIMMESAERFVKLCGEIGNFTEKHTGVSVVDAFFGPDELHPSKQSQEKTADEIVRDTYVTFDSLRDEIEDPLRLEYMMGELHSLNVVVDWLTGRDMSYAELVEGLFHITLKKFSEKEIDRSINVVEEAISTFPGDDLRDRITRFGSEGEITGEDLKLLIEDELQKKSVDVGQLFRDRVFLKMGASVPDNGVEYRAVKDKPWSGYNWYQGGFKSLNEFNIDGKFNRDSLEGVVYHEYEHHVSNLWREKAYLKSRQLELAIVPLHTGRCVISEGTADTAREFLNITDDSPRMAVVNALYALRRMTSINAAIMMNEERKSAEDAVDYMVDRGYRTRESAEQSIGFISPRNKDGRINFFVPYVYTYFIGRTDFVFPMFLRAIEKDVLPEFFKTIYMNPYSGSSVTWNKAFEWM